MHCAPDALNQNTHPILQVCEPEFLKASARRPPRVPRAISEFFHALLAFVALHAACSVFVAPLMRVVASFVLSSPVCRAPFDDGSGSGPAESSSWSPFGVGSASEAATASWMDCVGWAGKAAGTNGGVGGSGGWFFALLPGGKDGGHGGAFFESLGCCGAGAGTVAAVSGWPEFLAAAVLGMLFATPLVHSLTFYAFWHCACLGIAELWGYPDRFLYGTWF